MHLEMKTCIQHRVREHNVNKLLTSTAVAATIIFSAPAFANPAVVAVATTAIGQSQGQKQGQKQSQGQGQTSQNLNKTEGSWSVGAALGQAPTAASGCLKGTKFAFGLLEWTDHSSKCSLYELAAVAEEAAAHATDTQTANFYYIRANELRAKADGLDIPGN